MPYDVNDEEPVVEEVFSCFTYVKVSIPQCTNTPNKSPAFEVLAEHYCHQTVLKVSNLKGLIVKNGPCQYYIVIYDITKLFLMDHLSEGCILRL